ncbi:MAG: hypothetical protein RB191_21565 [Terriglobia bacterium]|nr:hypothetical protein [Terriglobia bacterium]
MTITVNQLKALANEHFIKPEQVGETVVRFLRQSDTTAFAVYYFDLTNDLPRTPEELSGYQDRVIAEIYFGGAKSLQWNTYLYFIPPAARAKQPDFADIRGMIEADRGYARKHIVSEQALGAIFNPALEASNDTPRKDDILETWSEKLQSVGIDEIVWGDNDMPARLDAIEQAAKKPRAPVRASGATKQPPVAEMIRSLKLNKYRPFPLNRQFTFGRVNLICGVNATGKTSLLEAIELFYCGRNYRSPHGATFDIQATFFSGKTENTTQKTPQKLFRDRNLHWYGQHEIKTNNIAASFAKYNFLNTDAAVQLAKSTDNAQDDLSKLLIGPDAARVWHTITNLSANLRPRLREKERIQKILSDERETLRKVVTPDPKRTQSSSLLRDRLQGVVDALGWRGADDTLAQMPRRFVGPLAQFVSVVEQALQLGTSKSETGKSLNSSRRRLRAQCQTLADLLKRWQATEDRISEETQRRKDVRAAKAAAQKAKRILGSKLFATMTDLHDANALVSKNATLLEGFDRDLAEQLKAHFDKVALSSAVAQNMAAQTNNQAQLRARRAEHAEFSRLHARASDLLDQLRDIAKQIVEQQDDPDTCPLCNTQLPPGGLAGHLQAQSGSSTAERRLSKAIRDLEREARGLGTEGSALQWMEGFCKSLRLPKTTTVGAILDAIDRIEAEQATLGARIKLANRTIDDLRESGLSTEALDEACDDLDAFDFPLTDRTVSGADNLLEKIGAAEQRVAAALQQQTNQRDALRASFVQTSERTVGNLAAAQVVTNELLKRHDALDQGLKRLSASLERFPWPSTRPLSRLIAEAKSVEKMASDLQGKLAEEEAQRKSEIEANRRLAEIEKDLKALLPVLERLKKAQTVLADLQNNHSLTQALDEALEENRSAIEHIFRSIHSPPEFSGLGNSLTNLRRISPPEDVDLDQISTGQRAALALSIFLAQNSQLTVAPPVLLIDDPIAHIDDLNCLSFLDYLREMVLEGRRQIFFATANDKLSALVTRKFDFLGEEDFRRIDLFRPILN